MNHHTGDIYRFSDHWGKVASCEWSLNDEPTEGWSIGVATFGPLNLCLLVVVLFLKVLSLISLIK